MRCFSIRVSSLHSDRPTASSPLFWRHSQGKMLLLRLFLLVMLIGYSKSEPADDKKTISNCDSMGCFAPLLCKQESTSKALSIITATEVITITCEAIVKIRSYTKKHILIVLQSNDIEVTEIKFEHGSTVLECKENQNKAQAFYTNAQETKEVGTISQSIKPLSCEFYVKTDSADVFNSNAPNVKLSSSKSLNVFTLNELSFRGSIIPTCDPEDVQVGADKLGLIDNEKIVKAVDGKLGDLVCSDGAKLMYSENNAKFVEASSITCQADENLVYGYVIPSSPKHLTNLKVQCETATCTLCDLDDLHFQRLHIVKYEEEGCPKLNCTQGYIKIGDANPAEGSAKCIMEGSKHLWKLKDETTSKSKEITCEAKVQCSKGQAKYMCDKEKKEPGEQNCVVTPELLPECLNGNLSLNGEIVEVQCSDKTSHEYQLRVKGKTFIYSNQILSCVNPDHGKSTDADKSSKTSSASIESVALYVILALVVIAVIVGVAVWFVLKKKKGSEAARPDFPAYQATAKEGQTKSKESKSVNSSKSNQGVESKKAEEKKEEEKKAESKKEMEKPRGPTRQERMRLEGMNTQEIDEAIAKVEALQVSMPSIGGSTRKNEESVRRRSKNKKDKKKDDEKEKDETKQPDAKGDANKNTEDKMKGDKMKEEKEKEKEPSDVTKAGVSGGQTNMTVTGAETVAGK